MNNKKLGFGLMRLPLLDKNKPYSIDIETTKKMVDTFIGKGFTYFDTAWMYCDFKSESATKEFLVKRHPRESFTLATKLHALFMKDTSDKDKIFKTQLENTGVKYFDYYLLHDLRRDQYKLHDKYDSFNWIINKKKQGLVKNIGFSFHDNAEFLDYVLKNHPEFDFVQLQINYLDWQSRNIESEKCYNVAEKYNKPVIVMEPVKGGTLANVPKDAEMLFKDYNPKMSVPSWAIRFAASLKNVFMVLSGMSNMEQINDNISYMENFVPLNDTEKEICFKAKDIISESLKIPCTGCSYCKEACPKNIPIPEIFNLYNNQGTDEEYEKLWENTGNPSDCIGCKKCEEICPQEIPVTKNLKMVY